MSRPAFVRAAFAFYRYPLYAYGYAYKYGTTLVSSLTVSTNAASTSDVYTYTYNNLGYITNIKKNGTTIASYSYDALGQLVSETNNQSGEIYVYTYDKAGNITKKEIYSGSIANLTDTITYTYGNTAWKDRLTNYDGNAITYDSIGNPTKWVGIAALTWNGRQLTCLSEDGLDHGVAFTYNADGIRTKKTFYDYDGSVTTHNYVLDGTTIVKETVTSGTTTTTLEYYYDETGIVSVRYNGTLYHYIKNLQGDIIGIVNSSNGALVVEYTYDAWGKILSVTGTMASTLGQVNPFRYRSYYYDSEIALYYLNSRFYDPQVGRFINADGIVGANGGLQGYNTFAYCNNNPVAFNDLSGNVRSFACNISMVGLGGKSSDEDAKNIFDYIKDGLEPAWGTYTYGFATSGTIGFWCFGIQGGLSSDLDGNIALQVTVSANASASEIPGYGWSGTQYSTVTNAPDITYLNDTGYQIGGAYGVLVDYVPVYGSADVNIIPSNGQTYYGVTTYGGFGSPGAEVHAGWSETFTVGLVNVWETWSLLYEALEACFE